MINLNNNINASLRLIEKCDNYAGELLTYFIQHLPKELASDLAEKNYEENSYDGSRIGVFNKYFDQEKNSLILHKYNHIYCKEIILELKDVQKEQVKQNQETYIGSMQIIAPGNEMFDKYKFFAGKVKSRGKDSYYIYSKYKSKYKSGEISIGYSSKEYVNPSQIWSTSKKSEIDYLL